MSKGALPPHQRRLNVFVLAMLCLAVVISLRNLPLTAKFGLSSVFYYVVATIGFMLPYALVSAELASGWPKAGGVYVWVREALGDRFGFFAMWMQWCHNVTWYPAMLAFIATGIVYPFNPELALNKLYILSVVLVGFWGVTLFNFFGIQTSALFSTFCVIIGAVLPGFLLIGMGIWWVIRHNPIAISLDWHSLFPQFDHVSHLVFLAGVFLALSGLEANANHAREVKNPRKSIPQAILIASILTLVILILGSLAIAIVIPQADVSLVSGVLEAFHLFFAHHHLLWLIPVVALFTVTGALGELNAWAIAGVKGLFVTTEHGCLPPILHKTNRHHVPTNLLLFQGLLVTVAAFLFLYTSNVNLSYWMLSAMATQMYLVMYILMLISAVVLRHRKPNVERLYRIPFGWVGIYICATLGIFSSLFAIGISFLPPTQSFAIHSLWGYESLLLTGFFLSCAIPLLIYACRRPHWKLVVLQEIREELHDTVQE